MILKFKTIERDSKEKPTHSFGLLREARKHLSNGDGSNNFNLFFALLFLGRLFLQKKKERETIMSRYHKNFQKEKFKNKKQKTN